MKLSWYPASSTPRANGVAASQGLRIGTAVEIPGEGHTQTLAYECTRNMMRDFIDHPRRAVDVTCLASIPPLRFVTDPRAVSGAGGRDK